MATEFIPTPELCEAIKLMAYNGLSMEEIAQKLGRKRDTLFYNSEEKSDSINRAYLDGKNSNKEDLLRKAADLTDTADSDSVKLNAIKYNLAIKHKVIEKQEVDTNLKGTVVVEWGNGNKGNNSLLSPSETTTTS